VGCPLLIGGVERSPVLVEARKPLVGRHLPKRVEEGVTVVEHGALPSGELLAGFALSRLRGPKG
jgi:hypothetical protein